MRLIQVKNCLILFLVRLLKPKIAKVFAQRHFLIISTTGLGDTLWATPAIRALRSNFPSARITVLTSPLGAEVLHNNPHIDTCIAIKDPVFFALPRLYRKLKSALISDVLLFHASQRSLLPLAAILGANTLIGTAEINKGLDMLLTHPIANERMHEIERRLHIVETAGANSKDVSLELFLAPEDTHEAKICLSTLQIPSNKLLVSMHPGAKDRFKQWPPSQFVALGKRLIEELNCQLFITGTPSEKNLVEKIAKEIPGAIPITHLKLRPFAAFLKKMNACIANDTGPMHVAFAMKTPTIALFTPTEPALCGPLPIQEGVIAKTKTCTPCLRKRCLDPFCLLQIGVDEVLSATLNLMKKRSVHDKKNNNRI